MNNLATGYLTAGKLDKALPLFEETLALQKAKLGPDHPDTLLSMNNLAGGYLTAGKLDKALPLLEETLALQRAKLGPDHPDTLTSMGNLAGGYWSIKPAFKNNFSIFVVQSPYPLSLGCREVRSNGQDEGEP